MTRAYSVGIYTNLERPPQDMRTQELHSKVPEDLTRVFIAETRERVKSMCCCSRPRFPSPDAGAQAYSTSGSVFPVNYESVFACEDVDFLLLLELGVASPTILVNGWTALALAMHISLQAASWGRKSFDR